MYRHADLLQFIAQKEAKCLELRSQLTAHEAELAQLKRKWERIVNRGIDRACAGSGSSVSPNPTAAVSSIIPTASAALKEGARLLAAGLDLSAPQSSSHPPSSFAIPLVPVSGLTTVSRTSLTSSSLARKLTSRHEGTQSVSSVSTNPSPTAESSAQSSQRLSQSSTSSVTSSFTSEDAIEEDSVTDAYPNDHALLSSSATTVLHTVAQLRRRSQDGANSETTSLPSTVISHSPRKASDPSNTSRAKVRPASMAFSDLSPSPASSPVSAWMGTVSNSVGRKWGEIQKGEAYVELLINLLRQTSDFGCQVHEIPKESICPPFGCLPVVICSFGNTLAFRGCISIPETLAFLPKSLFAKCILA